jgi:hypothetical protein
MVADGDRGSGGGGGVEVSISRSFEQVFWRAEKNTGVILKITNPTKLPVSTETGAK